MLARDIMTTAPVCVPIRTRLGEAISIMYENDIRHLPVLDGQRLAGILSDRDLRALWDPALDVQIRDGRVYDRRVSDFMSSDILTVSEDESLDAVIDLLVEHRIGAVPVIDADGVLIGIVSYIDVLKAAQGRFE
jgi:acetoin utilization protein AcuB